MRARSRREAMQSVPDADTARHRLVYSAKGQSGLIIRARLQGKLMPVWRDMARRSQARLHSRACPLKSHTTSGVTDGATYTSQQLEWPRPAS